MKFKDYYDVLGVKETASADEIKSAFRKLARKYHPDVSKEKDAEERFKAVNEAYEALRDPEKRQAYDQLKRQGYRTGDEVPAGGFAGGGFEFDPADLGSGGFSDFFEQLFGGGRGGPGRRNAPRKGRDLEMRLPLSLEAAHQGGKQRVSFMRAGEQKTLEVKIPAGVPEGQQIRLSGQGEVGPNGAGDLILIINLEPHPNYTLEGRNTLSKLVLAPWEAALGTEVPVQTLHGNLSLKIAPGARSGQKLRLKGKGFGVEQPGDHFAQIDIQAPVAETEAQRQAYQALAEQFPNLRLRG